MRTKTCVLGVALAAMSTMARAGVVAINFDPPSTGDLPASLTAMGNSPGSAVPAGSQLTNQYNTGATQDGVLFSSTAPFVAVVGATNPNGLGGVTAGGLLSYADPVIVTFVVPGTSTPGVTSNVSIQADATGIPGQFATVRAFDINDQLLSTQTLDDLGGEIWSFNLSGIHSIRFDFPTLSDGTLTTGSAFGAGTGIALDNLTFGTPTASAGPPVVGPPSSVPLPRMGSQGVLVLGMLTGAYVWRRRSHSAAVR